MGIYLRKTRENDLDENVNMPRKRFCARPWSQRNTEIVQSAHHPIILPTKENVVNPEGVAMPRNTEIVPSNILPSKENNPRPSNVAGQQPDRNLRMPLSGEEDKRDL